MTAGALASVEHGRRCPACGSNDATLLRSRTDVERELRARDEFFSQRLARATQPSAMKDLTDRVHGSAAPIVQCRCGVLVRMDECDLRAWRRESFDEPVLQRLHEIHASHFRRRGTSLRRLLPEHAGVLEVGSYVGGFLRAAADWGWQVTGIDMGWHTTRFTRQAGYDVRRATVESCRFEERSFDGVFVWNCFEQLPDPDQTLRELVRLLKSGGVLVLRVPDGQFYATCRDPLVLAWNGLLGFPHQFGFDETTLGRMIARHSLVVSQVRRTRGLLPLRGLIPAAAGRERRELFDRWGPRACGWLEMFCRR